MSELSPRELRLMLYLDGLLEGEELAAFERELASDPTLRAQVEEDRAITGRLGALLGPTDQDLATLKIPGERPDASAPAPIRIERFRLPARLIGGIAALLVVSTLGAVWWWNTTTRIVLPPIALLQPADIWQRELNDRFIPDWVCEDDEQMLSFTEGRFNEGLLFARVDNIEFMGWSYATNLLSGNSASMLARVDGEQVLVLVDKIGKDRPLHTPDDRFPALKMFRREVGGFVLYELTPLDAPAILDLAYSTGPRPPQPIEPPDDESADESADPQGGSASGPE